MEHVKVITCDEFEFALWPINKEIKKVKWANRSNAKIISKLLVLSCAEGSDRKYKINLNQVESKYKGEKTVCVEHWIRAFCNSSHYRKRRELNIFFYHSF